MVFPKLSVTGVYPKAHVPQLSRDEQTSQLGTEHLMLQTLDERVYPSAQTWQVEVSAQNRQREILQTGLH